MLQHLTCLSGAANMGLCKDTTPLQQWPRIRRVCRLRRLRKQVVQAISSSLVTNNAALQHN
jgi:hypothetical protein